MFSTKTATCRPDDLLQLACSCFLYSVWWSNLLTVLQHIGTSVFHPLSLVNCRMLCLFLFFQLPITTISRVEYHDESGIYWHAPMALYFLLYCTDILEWHVSSFCSRGHLSHFTYKISPSFYPSIHLHIRLPIPHRVIQTKRYRKIHTAISHKCG